MAKLSTVPVPVFLTCPVASLADQFDTLAAAWEAADKAQSDATCGLQDAMNGIVEAASHLTPRSLKGAAFQIMAASSQADSILNGRRRDYRAAAERRMERLLHRAMQAIGNDGDLPNVVAHLMPWRHKPEGKQQ